MTKITDEQVIDALVHGNILDYENEKTDAEYEQMVRTWLAEHAREVAAKALHDAARAIPDALPLPGGGLSIDYGNSRAAWLHARADGVSAGDGQAATQNV